MKAYAIDLRKKMAERVRKGLSKSEAARRFGVNRSTVQRYLKRLDEEGSLVPRKAPGKASKLDEGAMQLLEEDIKRTVLGPTHSQRSESLYVVCGVEVSEATICRAIKRRLGNGRKKINGSK